MCASHGSISLSIIILLVIIVIFMLIYYRGALGLGPYFAAAATRAGSKREKRGKKSEDSSKTTDGPADAETERLIDTINSQ